MTELIDMSVQAWLALGAALGVALTLTLAFRWKWVGFFFACAGSLMSYQAAHIFLA